MQFVRQKVSKKKRRYQADGFDLDLTWILPRVIAMGFPSQGQEALYRNKLSTVRKLLHYYHQDNWKVYNLCSERSYPAGSLEGRVARYGFDDHNPPMLPILASLIADALGFLQQHEENVVALHCKAGKGRTGVAISCLLLSLGLVPDAQAALDFFGEKRTHDGKGVTIPSQMRYVHYWERVLRHHQGVVPPPTERTVWGVRMAPFPKGMTSAAFYVKIFCDTVQVFCSDPIERSAKDHCVDFDTYGMAVRGNLKVSVFLRPAVGDDELFAQFWLYTAFIDSDVLQIAREDIDVVNKDKKGRFGLDFIITVYLDSHRLPGSRASRQALGAIVTNVALSNVIPREVIMDGESFSSSSSSISSSSPLSLSSLSASSPPPFSAPLPPSTQPTSPRALAKSSHSNNNAFHSVSTSSHPLKRSNFSGFHRVPPSHPAASLPLLPNERIMVNIGASIETLIEQPPEIGRLVFGETLVEGPPSPKSSSSSSPHPSRRGRQFQVSHHRTLHPT